MNKAKLCDNDGKNAFMTEIDNYMYSISASIVVTREKIQDIKTVINSYHPDSNRELYIVDNSEGDDYLKFIEGLGSDYIHHIKNKKNI